MTGLLALNCERLSLRMWNEREATRLLSTLLHLIICSFPDIDFYRESEVQEQLTNILFLYSVMHPSIGYRQGTCYTLVYWTW